MKRRRLLEIGLAGAALALLPAHTPYRQWAIYRKRHLLILTSKTDPTGVSLGRRVAEVLAEKLPASMARLSRAPHMQRIGSLISTKQMEVAILSRADAARFMAGQPPFADYGPLALRTLVALGDYLLVSRDDFPANHAWLVAETLAVNESALPVAVSVAAGAVPIHPGADAYFRGKPVPPLPPKAEKSSDGGK